MTKILVVEDDARNRQLYRDVLIPAGYTVVEAVDGESAIPAWQEHHPDIILLDIGLPGISGLEVARQIRRSEKHDEHVPILAVTSYTAGDDPEKALAAGCDAYMAKPVNLEELKTKLEEVLKLAR